MKRERSSDLTGMTEEWWGMRSEWFNPVLSPYRRQHRIKSFRPHFNPFQLIQIHFWERRPVTRDSFQMTEWWWNDRNEAGWLRFKIEPTAENCRNRGFLLVESSKSRPLIGREDLEKKSKGFTLIRKCPSMSTWLNHSDVIISGTRACQIRLGVVPYNNNQNNPVLNIVWLFY